MADENKELLEVTQPAQEAVALAEETVGLENHAIHNAEKPEDIKAKAELAKEKVIESLIDEVDGEIVEKKRWVLFGLPWTFTTYSINKDILTVDTGLFSKQENDCYMYKIVDVKLKSTVWQRMSALGDVICYTGDTTNPEIVLKNIKNSKDVKNYILKNSEVARLKRRTLNMLNIGAGDISDVDMT